MTKKGRIAVRRFRRVQEFLTTNPVNGTTTQLQVLSQVIDELSANGEELDATRRLTRGETARQRMLRDTLWQEHMLPIARIARRAFGREGLDVKFDIPRRKPADNEAILDAARGMAQVSEQHAEVFVRIGLPAEFVQQFRAAIEALSVVRSVKEESQRRKTTSSEAVTKLVKRGLAALAMLDAIVKPKLADKPDLAAAWRSVKRRVETGGGAGSADPVDITPVVKVA
jgi:hypothetical protein